jgi:uncharacterized protein YbcI
MTESEERPSKPMIEQALGEELLRIHEESYGKSARTSRVYIHDDVVFCMLDDLELMRNEEFLIGAGHEEAVLSIRSQYQQAIRATFSAAVERATGRRVISFASITGLDPNYVVEIFRLGPSERSSEGVLDE